MVKTFLPLTAIALLSLAGFAVAADQQLDGPYTATAYAQQGTTASGE